MPKLRVHGFAISLDGYGAGPRQDLDNPLGVGGVALHRWLVSTRTFRKTHGEDDGTTSKHGSLMSCTSRSAQFSWVPVSSSSPTSTPRRWVTCALSTWRRPSRRTLCSEGRRSDGWRFRSWRTCSAGRLVDFEPARSTRKQMDKQTARVRPRRHFDYKEIRQCG
jgi:hypothetical protein